MATNLDELLNQVRERSPDVEDLLRQIRSHFRRARWSINELVQRQVAQGLAAAFLERSRPFEEDDLLDGLVRDRLLNETAFMQKSPALLRFYARLLAGLKADRVLEIGVKGGGSTVLWKQLFPEATVVGLDIDLRPHLGGDGMVYIKGDQSDAAQLTALAEQYGPFDLVIDDGSHESAHQTVSLRTLFSHVRSGGLYVIEDIHENLKPEKGDDIWPDFIVTFFQRMRSTKAPIRADAPGALLALEIAAQVDDLILSARTVTLRRAAGVK
jgi:predicted O-methyltransferase YrrM